MAYRNNVTLQLGLINFQVSLTGATAKDETLNTVCVGIEGKPHEPTPIKQNVACPNEGCKNAEYSTFQKARKQGKQYEVVDPDELKALKDEVIGGTKDTIGLTPHPAEEVHSQILQDGSVYYLHPSTPASAKSYALIVEVLRETPEVALTGFWTPVSRTGLYEIKVFGDTLVMEQKANPEAVRVVQVPKEEADPMMKAQMKMILPMMTQPFDPATYANTYRQRLDELLASKTAVEGAEVTKGGEVKTAAVVDLTSQLTAMLATYSPPAAEAAPAKKTRKKATAA